MLTAVKLNASFVIAVVGTWNIWPLQENVKDGNSSILLGLTTIGE